MAVGSRGVAVVERARGTGRARREALVRREPAGGWRVRHTAEPGIGARTATSSPWTTGAGRIEVRLRVWGLAEAGRRVVGARARGIGRRASRTSASLGGKQEELACYHGPPTGLSGQPRHGAW
jgi:hypothetical protein